MTSREVDRAASQLEHLHRQRRARLLSSVAAAGLAAGTLVLSNALAISVACGVASLLLLALVDTLRRRELIARLARAGAGERGCPRQLLPRGPGAPVAARDQGPGGGAARAGYTRRADQRCAVLAAPQERG